MIVLGPCPRCGLPITLPSFALTPLSATCDCTLEQAEDPVEVGHRFDKRVQQLHTIMLSDLVGSPLESLMQHLEETVRNLRGNIGQKNPKLVLAFLIRLAALARYAAVDCLELEEASREL